MDRDCYPLKWGGFILWKSGKMSKDLKAIIKSVLLEESNHSKEEGN
jgi:hypothetical protein